MCRRAEGERWESRRRACVSYVSVTCAMGKCQLHELRAHLRLVPSISSVAPLLGVPPRGPLGVAGGGRAGPVAAVAPWRHHAGLCGREGEGDCQLHGGIFSYGEIVSTEEEIVRACVRVRACAAATHVLGLLGTCLLGTCLLGVVSERHIC